MEGEMPQQQSIPLTEIVREGIFIVDSVDDRDARKLRLLEANGIKAGAKLKVKPRTPVQGYSVSIGRSPKSMNLSREMAGDIRIVPPKEK